MNIYNEIAKKLPNLRETWRYFDEDAGIWVDHWSCVSPVKWSYGRLYFYDANNFLKVTPEQCLELKKCWEESND